MLYVQPDDGRSAVFRLRRAELEREGLGVGAKEDYQCKLSGIGLLTVGYLRFGGTESQQPYRKSINGLKD